MDLRQAATLATHQITRVEEDPVSLTGSTRTTACKSIVDGPKCEEIGKESPPPPCWGSMGRKRPVPEGSWLVGWYVGRGSGGGGDDIIHFVCPWIA
jgi:hypothetical protein